MEIEKTFEVVDVNERRVLALLKEDAVDLREYLDIQGDFWIDCDYMYCPQGHCVDFVCLTGSEKAPQNADFVVVHDRIELAPNESGVLLRFLCTLERSGMYNANSPSDADRLTAITFEELRLTEFVNWVDALRNYAIINSCYAIAFRGGVGYGYSLYNMSKL